MQNYQTKFFFTSKFDGNLAFHVHDDKKNVINNHKKLSKKYNYNYTKLIHMKQIHSDIVHIVDAKDNFSNPPECDALLTNKKNIPLMVMVADCTPIILRDEINGVIGVVHAGRQGAFKNILKETIQKMSNTFKCETKNIKVDIGASICQKCYEVGSEIYKEAKNLNLSYSILKKEGSFYLDVNKILLNQLKDLNIKIENINIINECNACHNNKYYSYRVEGKTGRFSGIVELID